jgi:adenine-specific DNA-methyltransferase
MPEKLKMHTPDLTAQNIQKLAELFPGCVTEIRDEAGKVTQGIDFDQLRQELSGSIVEGPRERYHLDWPGKREAILAANAPIAKTLRPSRNESVNFDTTKNLFIEGDNLDALKLLQETYLGKVKLIYIDPPYNTGNDFIYEDDFAEDADAYLLKSNQEDEGGNRLVANTDANGRFHSDWLSMIYARLKLGRNLLSEDGVIFISIDDGELENLRKACSEVLGEQNFVVQIIWKKRSTPPNDKIIGANHDYIVCFAKNISSLRLNLRERSIDQIARYQNPDNHPKGPWAPGDLQGNVKGGRYVKSLYFPIRNPTTGEDHYPGTNGNWRFSADTVARLLENGEIAFRDEGRGKPALKRFLCDVKSGVTYPSIWDFVPLNTSGSNEMNEIFGDATIFENPKPTGLINELIRLGADKDGLVLDFFGGSGTTAQSVMEVNASDGGKRRFILVQLPENSPSGSQAEQAGFAKISDLTKERIRRAGLKIKQQTGLTNPDLDAGFRVLKIDPSNMLDVYYTPDSVIQADLLGQVDNIRPDRTPEDLLFQVLVDWGLDLALPIAEETIEGKQVFFVDQNALAACFDIGVTDEMVKAIALRKPLRAVFRDSSYGTDSVKINVEQIFKLLSPDTEVRSI